MATTQATKTVVGVFDTAEQARDVVRALENAGFSRDEISIVANKNTKDYESGRAEYEGTGEGSGDTRKSDVAADAGIGAALGGIGGLLLSFAGLAVPGIGPVLAAGPILAALGGAGVGAVAGGLIGALVESGIPESEAHYYAEGVRRGHTLVTVRTDESRTDEARDIMDENGANDVEGRVSNWRDRGWTGGHNAGSEPLSSDELQRERDYFSAADAQGTEWRQETREAGTANVGTGYPHRDATDISVPAQRAYNQANPRKSGSLAGAQAQNAEVEDQDTDRDYRRIAEDMGDAANRPAPGGIPSVTNFDAESTYGDAIENNVRRPDRNTVRIEQGPRRAMDSAVASARRMRSRVYDRSL